MNTHSQLLKSLYEKNMVDEIMYLIRCQLSDNGCLEDDKDCRRIGHRFQMSGYGDNVTSYNVSILNRFESWGIYDYTQMLTIDFYKGCGNIYYLPLGKRSWSNDGYSGVMTFDVGGYSTSEIIFKILEVTIFSGAEKRRRD